MSTKLKGAFQKDHLVSQKSSCILGMDVCSNTDQLPERLFRPSLYLLIEHMCLCANLRMI